METSLRLGLLGKQEFDDSRNARGWLSHPACFPVDPALRELTIRRFGNREARVVPPGVLAVAVCPDAAMLLSVRAPQRGDHSDAVFRHSAAESMARAAATVLQHAPLLRRLPAADPLVTEEAWGIAWQGTLRSVLEGPSFGLAFALSAASRLMLRTPPGDVLCSVALGENGVLEEVDDLVQKVAVLFHYGLGIRRLVVHERQVAFARLELAKLAVANESPWVPEVCGVADLSDAMRLLLGDALEAPGGALTGEQARRELDELRRRVLRPVGVRLRWSAVERAAGEYAAVLERESVDGAALARDVARIARRHAGGTDDIVLSKPTDAELRRMPRPQRALYLAQWVQSCADAEDDHARTCISEVRELVPAAARECCLEELQLLGAVGRAYGALGDYEKAAEELEQVVAAWFENDQGAQASYALCELLRVRSLVSGARGASGMWSRDG